jgi:hypothetical protein
MVLPSFDFGGSRSVRTAAADLATSVELARERAIMTGRAHAVVIDVERGTWWVEWSEPLAPPEADAAPSGEPAKLDLVPPPLAGEALVPVAGSFGRAHALEDGVVVAGVELDGGVADAGEVELRFDADGATDPAVVLLSNEEGLHGVRVEIEPLADAVLVVNAE